MVKYVFTNSMKRHERSALCMKLYHEMHAGRKMYYLLTPMVESVERKLRERHRLQLFHEPVYSLKTETYKGTTFYLIMDEYKMYDVVFNTSPIDAGYVEFIRIVNRPDTTTMIYTQHALDRYNERIHNHKYEHHRDIIKRLVVNNPTRGDAFNEDNRLTLRVHEGFLCGRYDPDHKIIIINTFFDVEEYKDTKEQDSARTTFTKMNDLTPQQRVLYYSLRDLKLKGLITIEDYSFMLQLLKIEA